MGKSINCKYFSKNNFDQFKATLRLETALLAQWFKDKTFDEDGKSIGMEIEAWLVDQDFLPAPQNEKFLATLNHPNVVAELSQFNIEINVPPQKLDAFCLSRMHADIKNIWQAAQRMASSMGLKILMTGSLPTLRNEHLSTDTISNRDRYKALNEQIMQLKAGADMNIAIDGDDSLKVNHPDVMMEAATTSMQIHLKTPASQMNRYFNASIICSAPLVALSANTPFVFGKSLWDETRIPVFEQAVNLPGFFDVTGHYINRVGFGEAYVRSSILEFFLDNLDSYPVILPIQFDQPSEQLPHLLLHHGTIWRWNRPVIGVGQKSKPHLRIEERVCPAGPTIRDTMASTAFYLGLTHSLASQVIPPESLLSFNQARSNFYAAAKSGLSARVVWLDGSEGDMQSLLLHKLLPLAKSGLKEFGIADEDIKFYLDETVAPRLRNGQNGSFWQRMYTSIHGNDFQKMTEKYFYYQESDLPVHLWEI